MNMQKPTIGSHWRHYKSIGWTDHTYEVLGIAKHSETHEDMVVYRPLYTVSEGNWVYGYNFAVRPLVMWFDTLEHDGKIVQRFTQI